MDNLFLILFLVSFFALIVGLVKPVTFSRFIKGEITRKKIAIFFGIVTVVFFILLGVTTDTDNQNIKTQPVVQQNNDEEQPQTESNELTDNKEKTESVTTTFDVPVLLNKNISYFAPVFGKPVNENPEPTQIAIETGTDDTWVKVFEKDNYTISLTYNTSNGEITRIFLSKGTYRDKFTGDSWIKKREANSLLKNGNLSKSDNDYYFRFFWTAQDQNLYTGVDVQKEPFVGFKGNKLCNGYPEC